jgi:segregation and condensation protein A
MVELPSEFRARLDSYSGPLDLLLYLIKKEEVDVFDIPIARVVEQYQIYLDVIRQVDPNICGEFLVMAANLMEIKSKLLLPREELAEDEELEDPRLELVRQLLEYKKYKERAFLLQQRIDERCRRHERPPISLDPEDLEGAGPVYLGNVSVWDLLTAFHRIQIALAAREPHRVVIQDRPIEEFIAEIRALLADRPERSARFEDLFSGAQSRHEAICILLALLEMAKERLISVTQTELFGPIEVRLYSDEEIQRYQEDAKREAAAATLDPAEEYLLKGEGVQVAGGTDTLPGSARGLDPPGPHEPEAGSGEGPPPTGEGST